MRTLTRLFDDHLSASDAVRALERNGFESDDISLVSHGAEGSRRDDDALRDGSADRESRGDDAAEDAAKGAGIGGAVGGGVGLLAGLGMLAIPGLGPVVAAGWLASTAVGALGGAALGGGAGGLIGALTDSGESEEDAHVYAEGVRRGGTLVSVRTTEARFGEADRILSEFGGVLARDRGQAYRADGWRGYDPAAAPYTAEEIRRERERHAAHRASGRSFSGTGSTGAPAAGPHDVGGTSDRTSGPGATSRM